MTLSIRLASHPLSANLARQAKVAVVCLVFVMALAGPYTAFAEVVACSNCSVNDLPTKTELTIDWSVVSGNKIELVCVGSLHSWGATVYGPSSGTMTETIQKSMSGDSAQTCTGFFGEDEIQFDIH